MTIKLKTSKVELTVHEQRAVIHSKGRYKSDASHTTITRTELGNLIVDIKAMAKALKKAGVKVEYSKHYSEEAGFKKPLKDTEVPQFLRDGKPAKAESSGKATKPAKTKRGRVRLK